MRKSLSNHEEVCHYWANQVQEEGYSGNIFFKGDTIYSYGDHFKMAVLYPDFDICLMNSDSYSVSTAKHKSLTMRALSDVYTIIEVPYPNCPSERGNVAHLISEVKFNLEKSLRARDRKSEYIEAANYNYKLAMTYSNIFNTGKSLVKDAEAMFSDTWAEDIKKAKKAEAMRRREEKKKELLALTERIKEEKQAYRLTGEMPSRRVLNVIGTDLARVEGDEVKTSQRASVPLSHVKRMFMAIDNGLAIEGKNLGHYTVTSYSPKLLKVGCHKFDAAEMENMRTLIKGGK